MKYLVLIGDGMADYPLAELGDRTPLDAASTPAMDEAARKGLVGQFCPIPEDLPPGSDIGNLSLFGYDPHQTFTGRAPLEAASMGIALDPDQIAFRCNLVTLRDGVMESFTSGHITSEEAATIIPSLNAAVDGLPIRFHAGVSYRHLAILTGEALIADLARASCTPPHNITGQPYAPHLPQGPGAEWLAEIADRCRPALAAHPANAARAAAGKPAATAIWLWGQGCAPRMETYPKRFGLSGSVISAVDLVRGIGVCAGLRVIRVPGATGYLDTNYAGKVAAALDSLEDADFVFVHVEAPDETAHEGRIDLKIQAIEDFDGKVVAPCLDYTLARRDARLLVAPDHITAIATKTHAGGPVPFVMCGAGVMPGAATRYSEEQARHMKAYLGEGHRLTPAFLRLETITPEALAAYAG